eukprot:scaffold71346_cov41-Prasinocladus_malaysianus.AAC.1
MCHHAGCLTGNLCLFGIDAIVEVVLQATLSPPGACAPWPVLVGRLKCRSRTRTRTRNNRVHFAARDICLITPAGGRDIGPISLKPFSCPDQRKGTL